MSSDVPGKTFEMESSFISKRRQKIKKTSRITAFRLTKHLPYTTNKTKRLSKLYKAYLLLYSFRHNDFINNTLFS